MLLFGSLRIEGEPQQDGVWSALSDVLNHRGNGRFISKIRIAAMAEDSDSRCRLKTEIHAESSLIYRPLLFLRKRHHGVSKAGSLLEPLDTLYAEKMITERLNLRGIQ